MPSFQTFTIQTIRSAFQLALWAPLKFREGPKIPLFQRIPKFLSKHTAWIILMHYIGYINSLISLRIYLEYTECQTLIITYLQLLYFLYLEPNLT